MQRYAQLLCAMNVRKTGRIGDNSMCNERLSLRDSNLLCAFLIFDFVHICARLPAPLHNLGHTLLSLSDVAFPKRFHPRNQSGILDHERHQFSRVSPNVKELQAIFLDELLECAVRGQANTMTIFVLQDKT